MFSDVITIGPFTIHGDLAAALVGLLIASFVFSRLTFVEKKQKDRFFDTLFHSLIVFLLVWKLSPLLFEPRYMLSHPTMLLFARGGSGGLWIGSAAALLSTGFRLYRTRTSPLLFLDMAGWFFAMAAAVYFLLFPRYGLPVSFPFFSAVLPEHHPLHLYRFLVIWIAGGVTYRLHPPLGSGRHAAALAFLTGCGWLLTSPFDAAPLKYAGMTPQQWLYAGIAACGILLSIAASLSTKRLS